MGCATSVDAVSALPAGPVLLGATLPSAEPKSSGHQLPAGGPWTAILGMDFTGSDCSLDKAEHKNSPADHKGLHQLAADSQMSVTAYLEALCVLAMVAGCREGDLVCNRLVHGFGYGARDEEVFDLDTTPLDGFIGAATRYRELAETVALGSDHRSLAPLIDQASQVASEERSQGNARHHVLLALVSGPVSPSAFQATTQAVALAEERGLSVVAIGVGAGPFGTFLEETLPEIYSHFKFLRLAEACGDLSAPVARDRTHCARAIYKRVVESLSTPLEGACSERCARFCGQCGRLGKTNSSGFVCKHCGLAAAEEALKAHPPGMVTPPDQEQGWRAREVSDEESYVSV